ncbi:alpha/beta hydrolase family protein [Altererythrobacter sp. MTPC7]|uniref:alpha/beta hydrolase family protein n=1 Tax=Altererythrobacter sp. MTPC7 TaxID=3056567 RepID=UPI0036F34034
MADAMASSDPDISLEAMTQAAFLSAPRLSPDGSMLGHFVSRDDKRMLAIVDSDSGKMIRLFGPADGLGFTRWRWAGNRRVLIHGSFWSLGSLLYGGIPFTTTEVFDLDTGKSSFVGFKDQGFEGDDILHVDPAGRFVLLSVSKKDFDPPDVWRFPLDGSGADMAVKVQPAANGIDEWWADDAGLVRLGMKFVGSKKATFYYRSGPGEDLDRVTKIRFDDESDLENWGVVKLTPGTDLGYALVENAQGRQELRRFDYATGTMGELVYSDPVWDVTGTVFGDDGSLDAVEYVDDTEQREWLDPQVAKIRAQLAQALGQGDTKILQRTPAGKMLVWHGSASDPGVLYIFHPSRGQLAVYSELFPGLDETRTAAPKPIRYTARDGTVISGYMTLPAPAAAQGDGAGPHPLIVLPHGGPYGVRDTLDYDRNVQVLATRGYAVLQPNFRGSSGFGRSFEDLGVGQIGRAMQDDLDDAVHWAVEEGHADPDKVCIVGGSYGGYAALWGAIRNPDIYRCAASWAGPTDLDEQIKYSRGEFISRRAGKRWSNRLEGENTGERFDLDEVSPAKKVESLTRPVLVAHGTRDRIVPIEQFEAFEKAAEKAGKTIETLKITGADHGFGTAEREVEWLEALLGFLAEHNPTSIHTPDGFAAERAVVHAEKERLKAQKDAEGETSDASEAIIAN